MSPTTDDVAEMTHSVTPVVTHTPRVTSQDYTLSNTWRYKHTSRVTSQDYTLSNIWHYKHTPRVTSQDNTLSKTPYTHTSCDFTR